MWLWLILQSPPLCNSLCLSKETEPEQAFTWKFKRNFTHNTFRKPQNASVSEKGLGQKAPRQDLLMSSWHFWGGGGNVQAVSTLSTSRPQGAISPERSWETGFLETLLQTSFPECQDKWPQPGACCLLGLGHLPSLSCFTYFSPVSHSLPAFFRVLHF